VKFRLTVNGHNILLDTRQLESIVDILSCAEHLTETHVGTNQGSQGYQNSYVPAIKSVICNELFTVSPINQDYIDAVKLTMKLDDSSTIRVTT
jgi:hypothetical protein